MEFHPIIKSQFRELSRQSEEFVLAATPSDYGLIYSACSKLVREDPFWHKMRFEVLRVFYQVCVENESNLCAMPRDEEALKMLEDPEQMMKFAAFIRTDNQPFSPEIWNKLFVNLDNMLKKTEATVG